MTLDKTNLKILSLLLICEVLGAFVNTLTGDDEYPLRNCANIRLPIQRHLSKKQRTFCEFFGPFWNWNQVLNILKNKIVVIANVFPKLQTVKNVLRPLSKQHRFRTTFDSQHVQQFQALVKSSWEHFYLIFWSLSGKRIWKMSLLVICEILKPFVNTLTVDGNYPFQNYENFPLPIQMQLSIKKLFVNCLFHFWNLHQILNILKKKMIVVDSVLPKLHTVKDLVRPVSKKDCFRTHFDSQHVQGFQAFMNYSWEHF